MFVVTYSEKNINRIKRGCGCDYGCVFFRQHPQPKPFWFNMSFFFTVFNYETKPLDNLRLEMTTSPIKTNTRAVREESSRF